MVTNNVSLTENNSQTLDIRSRLGHFLEEYTEIATILPVLVGLFVTNRMQLRGAQALLVNLAIAAITRQTLTELKKKPGSTSSSTPSTPENTKTSVEDYTILHSVPGRIRLRIPRLIEDSLYAKQLEKLLSTDQRVLGVRINRAVGSLAVRYDGQGVSELELGMGLLQILDQAEKGVSSNSVTP